MLKEKLEIIAKETQKKLNEINHEIIEQIIQSQFPEYEVKLAKKASNELYFLIDKKILIDFKINFKTCPIHDVPTIVLAKQTQAKEVFIISVSEHTKTIRELKV